MMTRVAIKVRRGVKSCEREASKREPKGAMPPDELLSRDMVVYFDTGEVCQLLFKALVLVVSSRLVSSRKGRKIRGIATVPPKIISPP
jgi:hypothetical protein